MALTVREALSRAPEISSDSPRQDIEVLLSHALQKSRTWLYTWPDAELSLEQEAHFMKSLERRRSGEPVAYITGRRSFWKFDLLVSSDVLIPRPDTELLVELALAEERPARLADLGTGSGAVALALALEWPDTVVIATDQSLAALAIAQANAQETGLRNIQFRHGNWCEPLFGERFDMIVSNPPYIAPGDTHLRQGDLRFEPESALMAEAGGLQAIQTICHQAPAVLRAGGHLLLEHGYDQAAAVQTLLRQCGFRQIKSSRDLGGKDRITQATWIGETSDEG